MNPNIQCVFIFSRFQNYYSTNKAISVPSSSFSRQPLNPHHPIPPDAGNVTSLPPSTAPPFMPPPSVGPMRLTSKPPEMGPNRLQQPPASIGMGHPTFRSEFNVNLR